MSTLPALSRLGSDSPNALVPRRHGASATEKPALAKADPPAFVLDDAAPAEDRSSVVVIAVNVVRGIRGQLATEPALELEPVVESPAERVFRLPLVTEPYAQFARQDRGTLVDQYA